MSKTYVGHQGHQEPSQPKQQRTPLHVFHPLSPSLLKFTPACDLRDCKFLSFSSQASVNNKTAERRATGNKGNATNGFYSLPPYICFSCGCILGVKEMTCGTRYLPLLFKIDAMGKGTHRRRRVRRSRDRRRCESLFQSSGGAVRRDKLEGGTGTGEGWTRIRSGWPCKRCALFCRI